jgi:Protein of unknown function (DUF3309)
MRHSAVRFLTVFSACHLLHHQRGKAMLFLLLILIILIFVIAPVWPHSHEWGYYPSGGLGTILVIVIVLMLLGYIHL